MKKIVYLMMIFFAAVACSKDEGTIKGTAATNDGNVVEDITVILYTETASKMTETTTDNSGNFSFNGLKTGNYYIAASVEVNGETWDTGNTPQMVYVSDDILKEVTLTLRKK